MRKLLLLLLSFIVLSFAVNVTADDDFGSFNSFKPYSIIQTGISYRLDEHEHMNFKPALQIKFYRYYTPLTAFRFGLTIDHGIEIETYYSQPKKYRDIMLDAGFKMHWMRGSLSPYFELGIEMHNYYNAFVPEKETRFGINGAAGLSVQITKKYYIDFSLRHTINQLDRTSNIQPLNPSPNISPTVILSNFYDKLYNPTTIQLHLGIRL